MIQILPTVECAYCGKEMTPKEMKIGSSFVLMRKWNEKKGKFQTYASKRKDWYCRDGCHLDDRYSDDN